MKKVFFTIVFITVLSLFGQAAWADDGPDIYKRTCQACHGENGRGTQFAPAFNKNAFISDSSAEDISTVIREGRSASSSRYEKGTFTMDMPRQRLTEIEMAEVVSHLKTLSGYELTASDNKPEEEHVSLDQDRGNDEIEVKTEAPAKAELEEKAVAPVENGTDEKTEEPTKDVLEEKAEAPIENKPEEKAEAPAQKEQEDKPGVPVSEKAVYIPITNLLNVDFAIKKLEGHLYDSTSVGFSPDGKKLASGGSSEYDSSVNLWDVKTGAKLKTFVGHKARVLSVVFSPDGKKLASVSEDYTINLWEVATGKKLKHFKHPSSNSLWIAFATFSPDGKSLALVSSRDTSWYNINLWDMANGRRLEISQGFGSGHFNVAFSPDSKTLASRGSSEYDSSVNLWNVKTGRKLKTFEGHSDAVNSVAFSPDGKMIVSGSWSGSVILWEVVTGGMVKSFKGHPSQDFTPLAFSPNGQTLASGGSRNHHHIVNLWDVATGSRLKTFKGHTGPVAFSPDGKSLATGSGDKAVGQLDMSTFSIYGTFSNHKINALELLETERDARLKEIFRSKGVFEKTSEYEERIRAAKDAEVAIRREYSERIREAGERAEKELKEMIYPVTLKASLGGYDADKESIETEMLGIKTLINIPVEKAAEISKRKDNVAIEGQIRYFDETKAELVNPFLVDTATKEQYAFGRHTDAVMTASSRKAPPELRIASIKLTEPSANGILDAGEKGRLTIALRNTGKGAASGVSVTFSSGRKIKGLNLAEKIYVGQINPNEEKSVEVDISGLEDIESADLNLKAKLVESSGFDSQPVIIAFKTKALVPPLLQVAKVDIEDTDGRRVITKGKEAKVTLTVQNAGQGASRDVVVTLRPDDADIRMFGDSTFKIGVLLAGESKKAVFSVAVTSRYNGPKELPLHVIVNEGRERFSVKPDIKFALDEDAPDVRVVKVEARILPTAKVEDIDDINTPPAFSQEQKIMGDQDVAIVIGVERYRKLPKAEYAYNDAKAVKGYLKAMGFSERNIKFLVDEEATLSGINSSIGTWLPNRIKKESRVFIYYSGHGSPDPATGEAYLMPHDGDPSYLADTGYSLKKLYDSLAKLDAAEVAVVLDSCFSGTGGRSVLAKGARPMVVFVDEGVLASKNLAVLSSTQGAQISTSYAEKEHGLFTYYFLKAVREGKKDIGEIYSYIKPLVEDEARAQNVEQSPSLKPGPEEVKARFGLRR